MNRVHVDWTRCDGHGSCVELLPELLTVDDWGFPLSSTGDREPTVPPGLAGRAEHAARSCPWGALLLVRDPGP